MDKEINAKKDEKPLFSRIKKKSDKFAEKSLQ